MNEKAIAVPEVAAGNSGFYDAPEAANVDTHSDYTPQRKRFYRSREGKLSPEMKQALAAAITPWGGKPNEALFIAALKKEGVSQPLLEILAVGDGWAKTGENVALMLAVAHQLNQPPSRIVCQSLYHAAYYAEEFASGTAKVTMLGFGLQAAEARLEASSPTLNERPGVPNAAAHKLLERKLLDARL